MVWPDLDKILLGHVCSGQIAFLPTGCHISVKFSNDQIESAIQAWQATSSKEQITCERLLQSSEAFRRSDGAKADSFQSAEDRVIVRCHSGPAPCAPLQAYRVDALQGL